MPNQSADGLDHINIYSKGMTELGRALSNFSHHPIATSNHGTFASIEGYWYWLGVPPDNARREELRKAVGWSAKQLGRELRGSEWGSTDDFRLHIIGAMVAKLTTYPAIRAALKSSKLPLRHYYTYGDKIVEPAEGKWIVETWEYLRCILQGGSIA